MDYQHHLNWLQPAREVLNALAVGEQLDGTRADVLRQSLDICQHILNDNPASEEAARVRDAAERLLHPETDNLSKQFLETVCKTAIRNAAVAGNLESLVQLEGTLPHEDRNDWQLAMSALERQRPNWKNSWTVADIVNAISAHWAQPRGLLLMMNELPTGIYEFPECNARNLWRSEIETCLLKKTFEIHSEQGPIPIHVIKRAEETFQASYAINHGHIVVTEGFSQGVTDHYDRIGRRTLPIGATPPEKEQHVFCRFLMDAFPSREERRDAHLQRIMLEEIIHYVYAEQAKKECDFHTMTPAEFWEHAVPALIPQDSFLYGNIAKRKKNPTPAEAKIYHDENMAWFELVARMTVGAKMKNPHYLLHEFGMLMHDNTSYPHYASARLGIVNLALRFQLPQQLGMKQLSAEDISSLQRFKDILASRCPPDELRKGFETGARDSFVNVFDKEPVRLWNSYDLTRFKEIM